MSTSVSSREPMDARIRARRARVRADAVKRRQRRTVSLFFVLLLIAAVSVALRSPLFEITAIDVRGVGAERGEVVRQTAGIHEGQHLLTAPLEQAQAAVERLAWVKAATVHRVPPSTVAVDVTPRRPMLTVETSEAAWMVDEDAVVVDGGRVADAPVIDVGASALPALGEAIADPTVRDAVLVHRRLPAWLRSQVVAYRVRAERDLWLRLRVADRESDDTTVVDVRFGSAGDLALKTEVIRVLLPQAVEQEGDLDVRAPANPVVVAPRAAASGAVEVP